MASSAKATCAMWLPRCLCSWLCSPRGPARVASSLEHEVVGCAGEADQRRRRLRRRLPQTRRKRRVPERADIVAGFEDGQLHVRRRSRRTRGRTSSVESITRQRAAARAAACVSHGHALPARGRKPCAGHHESASVHCLITQLSHACRTRHSFRITRLTYNPAGRAMPPARSPACPAQECRSGRVRP